MAVVECLDHLFDRFALERRPLLEGEGQLHGAAGRRTGPFFGAGSPQRHACSQQHERGHGNGPRRRRTRVRKRTEPRASSWQARWHPTPQDSNDNREAALAAQISRDQQLQQAGGVALASYATCPPRPARAGRRHHVGLCRLGDRTPIIESITSKGSRMRKHTAGKWRPYCCPAVAVAGCPGTTHMVKVGYRYEPEETCSRSLPVGAARPGTRHRP